MLTVAEIVTKARALAKELQLDMHLEDGAFVGKVWTENDFAGDKVRGRAITALDFLDRFAGPTSQWAIRGHQVFDAPGKSVGTAAHADEGVSRYWGTIHLGMLSAGRRPSRPSEATRTLQ
jgi:hypothetical protein